MKLKICSSCQKECYLWKSSPKLCRECAMKSATQIGNYKLTTKVVSSDIKSVEKKKRKAIAPISDKQKERLKRYRILRDDYMDKHRFCEANLEGCKVRSSDLHHKKSRVGENLFSHFMAVCRSCHNLIEEAKGEWVYEQGFKIKRTE